MWKINIRLFSSIHNGMILICLKWEGVIRLKKLSLLILLVLIFSKLAAAEVEDNSVLYKDFYYGESARSVYEKIFEKSDLRPENLEASFEEWLENERYDGYGPMRTKTMNSYYSMQARTILLNKTFICRFRFDKEEVDLFRIVISGPAYNFREDTNEEIEAFKKMFQKKYEAPSWPDAAEREFEILNLGDTFSYNWQDIWGLEDEKGKKEIKIGVLQKYDDQQNEVYSSVISIEYSKKAERKEEEEIKEEDIEDLLDDF